MRHELTYALPHLAVQARIGLARACIALTDLAGARTLTRETGELSGTGPASEPSSARPKRSGPSCPSCAAQTPPGRRH